MYWSVEHYDANLGGQGTFCSGQKIAIVYGLLVLVKIYLH